ncbi:hypothetical protein CCH79_00020508 [Gambusia affinis]|uniref:Uncharacterized protein n=1 Tax=Gambusia affinis TaxID=33528 RepID=A0A315VX95_GAMAF|nr:hypothetical protein CCH79_00020508 [Gambusia affinis]
MFPSLLLGSVVSDRLNSRGRPRASQFWFFSCFLSGSAESDPAMRGQGKQPAEQTEQLKEVLFDPTRFRTLLHGDTDHI